MKKLVFLLVAVLIAWTSAQAQTTIKLGSGATVDKRSQVAVPPLATSDGSLSKMARELSEVIGFDLEFSGLFNVIAPAQFPPQFTALDPDVTKVDFNIWRVTKAEYFVYGYVRQEGNEFVGQFRLFDMATGQQIVGQELRVDSKTPRLAAHRFSEEVIRAVDGTPGSGTSEICFSGGETGKKEIYISDYDGANVQQVTKHGSISIKPKFSPDGNKIAYLSYKDRFPFIYVYDRRSGKSVPVSQEPGINAVPAWSPDSSRLAMVLSKDGNMEIYVRDADGKHPVRLTKNRFMDTSPAFSPDGSQIAFVSDRGGSPQVYLMPASGGEGARLTNQGGNSYDPAWSPDGKKIAFVVEKRGEGFQIWWMNADGSGAAPLTGTSTNESPTWSPDGRNIMFMSQRAGKTLWAVNVKLGQEWQMSKANMSFEGPSWGPRRK